MPKKKPRMLPSGDQFYLIRINLKLVFKIKLYLLLFYQLF